MMQPWKQTQAVTLYNGDCLEILQSMPDNSVDLVFTSPPYEAARTYGIGFNLRGQDWVDWCVERFIQCVRISRGLVAWNVEGQTRKFRYSAAPLLLAADLHRAGIHLRKPPIFARVGIPGSGGPDWLRNDYEFIICGSKGGRLAWSQNTAMGHIPKWDPGGAMSHRLSDGTKRNQWGGGEKSTGGERGPEGELKKAKPRPSHRFSTKVSQGGKVHTKAEADGTMREQAYMPPTLANPGNIVKCKVGGGLMGSPLAHENEAPFPEKLAEFFIRSFCPPDGIVLDPFCGSGTTLAVASKTSRKSIGIDVRESQVELSMRRISSIQVELIDV